MDSSIIVAWIFGIVGNLVASYVYDAFKLAPLREPHGQEQTLHELAATPTFITNDSGHPNRNRMRVSDAIERLVIRFLSLYCLYAGFALPLMIKAMIPQREVLLSDARFIGIMLPNRAIHEASFQLACILFALALSFPTAQFARFVYNTYDRMFQPISYNEWARLTVGAYLFVGAVLAVGTTYLYYQVSFLQAVITVLLVAAAPVALGINSARS